MPKARDRSGRAPISSQADFPESGPAGAIAAARKAAMRRVWDALQA
jgi:hypothetical protein